MFFLLPVLVDCVGSPVVDKRLGGGGLAKRELARRGSSASLSVTTLLHEAYLDISARDSASFPVAASTTAQKLLAPQAAQAALLWQFEPASRNGVPVNSETLLTFEFERPSR